MQPPRISRIENGYVRHPVAQFAAVVGVLSALFSSIDVCAGEGPPAEIVPWDAAVEAETSRPPSPRVLRPAEKSRYSYSGRRTSESKSGTPKRAIRPAKTSHRLSPIGTSRYQRSAIKRPQKPAVIRPARRLGDSQPPAKQAASPDRARTRTAPKSRPQSPKSDAPATSEKPETGDKPSNHEKPATGKKPDAQQQPFAATARRRVAALINLRRRPTKTIELPANEEKGRAIAAPTGAQQKPADTDKLRGKSPQVEQAPPPAKPAEEIVAPRPNVRPLPKLPPRLAGPAGRPSLPRSLTSRRMKLVDFQPPPLPDPFKDEPKKEKPEQGPIEGDPDSPFTVIGESGELTVTLRRSKLLRTKLDVYRTAVVDPSICEIVQFTPRELSIIGKGMGATHVTFWFRGGDRKPVTYLVKVKQDNEETNRRQAEYKLLSEVIADLFPNSKVKLIPVADKLIVRGQAKGAEEAAQILAIIRGQVAARSPAGDPQTLAEGPATVVLDESETGRSPRRGLQVINMLRIPGVQQVALRVKIAELNRTAARGFGIDVDANINVLGDNNLLIQSMLNVINGGAPALLANLDGDDVQLGFRWLEQHGVLRILSEPTLVTMSGRPATFVAGGEFAVPTVVGTGGLSAATTDFRSFGVILSFLPVVMDKDRIRLEVAPEFSQINSDLNVGDTPGLNVRSVTTTVEMREGQTLAIAGLLDDQMKGDKTGDLPLLSKIFGHRNMTHSETELIILVTPELVSPMEPEAVPPLPGFDVTEPTDWEFYGLGYLEGIPTREFRSTVWPRLIRRYQGGGPAMISGPFGHGQ